MTKPFTGTQAQLADELARLGKKIYAEWVNEYQTGFDSGNEEAFRDAATLVRNAIITEAKQ